MLLETLRHLSAPYRLFFHICTHRLETRGLIHYYRYQETGALADLRLAIERFKEVLNRTPESDTRLAYRVQLLGAACLDQYRRTGDENDLELAIGYFEEALRKTPKDDPDLADRFGILGAGYLDRHQRRGAMADLNLAIEHFQVALDKTAKDDPCLSDRFHSLAAGYNNKYRRTRAMADLELAIEWSHETLRETPRDYPDLASRFNAIATGYREKFRATGEMTYLDAAIQFFQDAVHLTHENHLDLPQRRSTLGIAYRDRYLRAGAMADLELAIHNLQAALDLTPNNDPRADRCNLLAAGLLERYLKVGARTDLDTAVSRLFEATLDPSSSPLERLRSYKLLAEVYAAAEDWQKAYRSASGAVEETLLALPRFLENSDKQYLLLEATGLASDAAALALTAGRSVYRAVQHVEEGRGVIIGSLSELRTDISDLQHQYPDLAEEYVRLRDQIDAFALPANPARDLARRSTDQSGQRYDIDNKLSQVIKKIRGRPGFRRFNENPTEAEMMVTAASGPICIINVSEYRCDALLIEADGLRSIRLPHLHIKDIRHRALALAELESLNAHLLEWLWDVIAEPVLDALGFTKSPDLDWPRVWWIPTGPLVKFPIHAAGHHSLKPSCTVLDRVISSYASSVKTLIQSRQGLTEETRRKPDRVVLVGMPELQNAPQEVENLESICNSLRLQVKKPQPHLKAVLAALHDCDVFHFAGHGKTHLSDPSKSALLLRGEDVTVASLFEAKLQKRRPLLAYLSACGTGQMKHDALIDEGLHLIAACQLAGFQHVIGTLWVVNDEFCVDVATTTYEWMRTRDFTSASISEGLHRASRELRSRWVSENNTRALEQKTRTENEDGPTESVQSASGHAQIRDQRDVVLCDDDAPLYWIPYVHFGV